MSWTAPRTWVSSEVVTAAMMNTHVRDNLSELRAGGFAIASQAAQDFLRPSSSTQIGRQAPSTGTPQWGGASWSFVDLATQEPIKVGGIFESVVSTNPNTLLGYGTWAAVGTGRTFVCIDTGQTEFDTLRETGGSKTHTLVTGEMPVHSHTQNAHGHSVSGMGNSINVAGTTPDVSVMDNAGTIDTDPQTATNQNAGSGTAHNNLQPYIVIYRWERTA